ncbi:NAD-dependent epimerase/dehydratase family protein [Salinarimonas ramus]|uniref:GDP-6-deoxy-D-lyxo-4-hexulose reductase n=1 Tax=Salinarimonas ramus TaxID=690164 RepID=A0A917QEP0_9HYPH|nr:GDP-mannose 4,6-dehydratase [Salinarimonas ramus]GGK46852.1 GDP-6-deoxy-D-lyxo-4-hexulose reductase [Salinarimonas ramus]
MAVAPRTLVTGATGFTGRHLVRALRADGHEVFATGASPDAGFEDGVAYRPADLMDEEALRGLVAEARPTNVVHLAAIAFVAEGDAEAYYRTNVIGTRRLLEALVAEAGDAACVLVASSANVYGAGEGTPLAETSPVRPANDYGVSKVAMEHLCRTYADRLPIVLVRPFNYTGVGQSERFLVPKIVAHFARRAETISLGNTDVRRDFSDVRDVVDAYRRLLAVAPVGETLNVCSGVDRSLDDVIAICRDVTGHDIRVEVDPRFVRARDIPVLVGDRTRLSSVLGGFDPRPIEETIAWMLGTAA